MLSKLSGDSQPGSESDHGEGMKAER